MTCKFDRNHQHGASCLNCLLLDFLKWLAGEGLWNLHEEDPELILEFLDWVDFDLLSGKTGCQLEMAEFYASDDGRERSGD